MSLPEDPLSPRPPATDELPSYGLEEDAPTGWRAWLRGRRLVLLVLILTLAVSAAFGIRPLYREIKARRALTIAEQAGEALDAGDGAKASTLLRQASLMAFNDNRVADRVTFHAARAGDMASVAELGKKLTAGTASTEEILIFGERSLGAGLLPDAARAVEALPAELPPDDAARRDAMVAGQLLARKQIPEATTSLRKSLAILSGPEGDNLRVMLANTLLASEDTSGRAEAQPLLEQASTNTGPEGASALRLLALSSAGLSPEAREQMDQVIERLRNHPAATDNDELFIARLLVSADPSRKDATVTDLVQRLNARGASTDARVVAARWLIGLQINEPVLDLIQTDEPSRHAGALMVRLDALSELERWEECGQLVEETRGGTLPDSLYHLFRARIAETRGETSTSEAERRLLRQVMQFAEMPHILFAARYAESIGWKPEAFSGWRILATDPAAAAEGLRGQLRTMPVTMTASDGADIAAKLLELQPDDPSALLSSAYFRLMAGQMIDSSSEAVETLLAADPNSVDVRRVAALGRLRTGQAARGLEIWPAEDTEPRWHALHAALLRGAGEIDRAKAVAKEVNPEDLSPDERELLRDL